MVGDMGDKGHNCSEDDLKALPERSRAALHPE
jgi:hypothetical protein